MNVTADRGAILDAQRILKIAKFINEYAQAAGTNGARFAVYIASPGLVGVAMDDDELTSLRMDDPQWKVVLGRALP